MYLQYPKAAVEPRNAKKSIRENVHTNGIKPSKGPFIKSTPLRKSRPTPFPPPR